MHQLWDSAYYGIFFSFWPIAKVFVMRFWRDCFLYEIAVIELIYGPLNAASVVIYADCMQQI